MKKLFTLLAFLLYFSGFAQTGIDWAGNQTPGTVSQTTTSGSPSVTMTIQIYKAGTTEGAGQGSNVECQIAWASVANFNDTWGVVNSINQTYSSDVGNNDVYTANITPASSGKYEAKCRCRQIGQPEWYWANGASNIQITATSVLKIALNDLTLKQNNRVSELSWQTASEKDNALFQIERSANATDFSPIGEVKGAGNSTATKNYTFTDATPLSGVNYYRLKAVDYNGAATLSKVVSVNFSSKNDTKVAVYPNPTRDVLRIDVHATDASTTLVQITDLMGRVVLSQNISVVKGANLLPFNVASLPSGAYFVKVNADVVRFVKL